MPAKKKAAKKVVAKEESPKTERASAVSLDGLSVKERDGLKAILAKEPAALSEVERAHLKGRKAYLSADQRKDYGVK